MTEYKRGNSLWTKFQYKGKRYQFKINPAISPYETRDKVKQLVDEGHKNVQISDGVAIVKPDRSKFTWFNYVEYIYRNHWEIYTKDHQKTLAKAKTIGFLLGSLQHQPLSVIDGDDIKELTTRLLHNKSKSTVNRYLAVLKFVLNRAYDDGIIDRVTKIKMFKEPKGRIRVLTDEELRTLISFCYVNGLVDAGIIFSFLVNTGLRLNEVLNLTRSMSKFDDELVNKIFIKDHKTGNNREIPLNPTAGSIMANYPHYFDGSVKESYLRGIWNNFKKAKGITDKDFVIHSLRHTFASKLINKGVSIFTVKELLGHKSIKTTERYCHLNLDSQREAVHKL